MIALVERLVEQVASVKATLLADALAHFGPLVQQVIDQSRRRMLEGQTVPASGVLGR